MILRRFMKHVKDQNWFAVGLDIIVVIVGIFLGLQVQSWYDGRQKIVEERIYLINLHEDIQSGLEMANIGLREQETIQNGIIEILDFMAGDLPVNELSNQHCSALALSHKQANPISDLPAAQELISSGNLKLITNNMIRRSISDYFGVLDLLRDRRDSTQPFMVDMTNLYPDIIEVDLKIARKRVSETSLEHRCHYETGLSNGLFKNQLAMNSTRQWQLIRTIEEQINSLGNLHKHVDLELGITHED
jgi:hypothetical protein